MTPGTEPGAEEKRSIRGAGLAVAKENVAYLCEAVDLEAAPGSDNVFLYILFELFGGIFHKAHCDQAFDFVTTRYEFVPL